MGTYRLSVKKVPLLQRKQANTNLRYNSSLSNVLFKRKSSNLCRMLAWSLSGKMGELIACSKMFYIIGFTET